MRKRRLAALLLAGGVVLGLSIDPLFKLIVKGADLCMAAGDMSDANHDERESGGWTGHEHR
jgi:hypothetical protein